METPAGSQCAIPKRIMKLVLYKESISIYELGLITQKMWALLSPAKGK